jgi:hypothetical protein
MKIFSLLCLLFAALTLGAQMTCELSLPEGYCTVPDCETIGCPDDGVCIVFNQDQSFCMLQCANDADCREGYVCVTQFGAQPFCNDAAGEHQASAEESP